MTRNDKIRNKYEGDGKDCKVGRQTLEYEALLVWICEKERRLCGKKDTGDGGAKQKKRKAKEEVDRHDEGRYGED